MTMAQEISKLIDGMKEIKMKMEEREERSIRETEEIWRRLETTGNETQTQATLQHEREICRLRVEMEKIKTELGTKINKTQLQNGEEGEFTANLFAAKVSSFESRLASLESAVTRAVDSSFPRLEALLAKMDIVEGEEKEKEEESIPLYAPVSSARSSVAPDPEMGRALVEAAKEGDAEEVHRLLADGADVLHKDCDGWHPLHYAAYGGHAEAAAALLHAGAGVDCTTALGATALHWAAFAGRWPLVLLLLQHGAAANATDAAGRSPLHDAASNAHSRSVRLLLDAGADPRAQTPAGNTPLDYSVNQEVRALLQRD